MSEVTLQDFADSFGTTADDIPVECRELIGESDFSYRILDGEERDNTLLEVLKRIKSDRQVIGAPERKNVWQDGWENNLRDFIASGYNLDTLIPRYVRKDQPIRFNRRYVIPANPLFEWDFLRVLRVWIFIKYLKNCKSFYEFGCGTGHNLVELSRLYPDMKLYGFDFVPAACKLVDTIGEVHGLKMIGRQFDMTSPDNDIYFDANSAVFTFGAIEQLAGNFEPFLQFLLHRKPSLCINIEPTIELFDETNLVDYLAIEFQRKRGYSEKYLPRLKELESQGKIEIVKVKRTFLGNLMMEGYSLMVWRPAG